MTDPLTLGSYDLLLAVLPVPLLLGVLVGALSTVAMLPAVAVGSVVSSVPLSYTLFLDPPTGPSA